MSARFPRRFAVARLLVYCATARGLVEPQLRVCRFKNIHDDEFDLSHELAITLHHFVVVVGPDRVVLVGDLVVGVRQRDEGLVPDGEATSTAAGRLVVLSRIRY